MRKWVEEVRESHDVEVAIEGKGTWMGLETTASAKYGYRYEHTRTDEFASEVRNMATKTFQGSLEVTQEFTIPAQVDGEPSHSNIWFWKVESIKSNFEGHYESLTHSDLSGGSALETDGCGYWLQPNCLPGYCAHTDPHCWECIFDWAMIDPDFDADRELAKYGGCDCEDDFPGCNSWKAWCPGGSKTGYEDSMASNCCKTCTNSGGPPMHEKAVGSSTNSGPPPFAFKD